MASFAPNLSTSGAFHTLLQSCLEREISYIGQVMFTRNLQLSHMEDSGCDSLHIYTGPDAAREIARFDDAGQYRPLKSAPNLRHGWELRLASIHELHMALDFFYPAALGLWLALLREDLVGGTPLRKTLERQSGMYRVAASITDEQAKCLIRDFCEKQCLRDRVWEAHPTAVDRKEKNNLQYKIPLICSEACNLFIAQARRVVKKSQAIL